MIRTRSSEKDNIMYCCKDCSDRMKATWQSMNKKTKINVGDYVKVCVKEGRKKEHMWFEIVECSDMTYPHVFKGILRNTPAVLKTVDYGDKMIIKFSEIEAHQRENE